MGSDVSVFIAWLGFTDVVVRLLGTDEDLSLESVFRLEFEDL